MLRGMSQEARSSSDAEPLQPADVNPSDTKLSVEG
jgi:hypothetical protein